jgi:hypothetical protein
MSTSQRILFYFIIPILAPLILPPRILAGAYLGIIAEVILFGAMGFFLMSGRSTALKLSIFFQGLNVIIRLMMLFPRATLPNGTTDPVYILTSVISIALSLYLVLRLDRVDIRTQMVK